MNASDSAKQAEESQPPTFAAMGLSTEVQQAIDEIGYEQPTPVQFAAYGPAIAGTDIIVQARTGTGKTAAFGIPLVDKIVRPEPGVQALVLAPTRELALQSAREIERLSKHKSLRTVAVYGGAPMGPQIDELRAGAQIVSGTPGRVLDHLKRGTFDSSGLRVLVLDEMDEMLSMGFAKELNAILDLIPGVESRQTMCFSATVDGAVRRHAERHMRDPEVVSLSSDAVGAEQISHSVYMVSGTNRGGDLIQVLNTEDPESAIVFCNMRSETERVATELQRAGFNADWLNGDLPQKDRERIMARTREGKLRYLVATDVAARGIDISHLTHVINFSFPESAATYVHRTGRTGRAGRTGNALSLVSPQELGRLYYLRLEFNITPVERTLPNSGEQKTQLEIDRLNLLEGALGARLTADDRALARRLLTHPEVERILGGLLHAFFAGDKEEDVDERAAKVRRDKAPAVVPGPRQPRSEDARRTTRSRERPARRRPEDSAPAEDSAEPGRSRRPRRAAAAPTGAEGSGATARRSEDTSEPAKSEPTKTAESADAAQAPKKPRRRRRRTAGDDDARETTALASTSTGSDTPPTETNAPSPESRPSAGTADAADRPKRRRRRAPKTAIDPNAVESTNAAATERPTEVAEATNADRNMDGPLFATAESRPRPARSERKPRSAAKAASATSGTRSAKDADDEGESRATVFLNVGRRDGARSAEIVQLMQDTAGLNQEDVGRVRMRDRYTYVDIPEAQIETVLERLEGAEVADRPVDAERAKVSRS